MAFTRFNYDDDRLKKELQQATGSGRYILNVPGNGSTPLYFDDPYIRVQGWGANLREVINGAMKIISGLDWLEHEIHHPTKLIDYCLNNKPILEGCDVVDYIYVLYKCSKQTDYKKREINLVLMSLFHEIKLLYSKLDGGFSYFKNKSQTHYYGVPVSKGLQTSDIHGTLLCSWALLMILDLNNKLDTDFNIIKP